MTEDMATNITGCSTMITTDHSPMRLLNKEDSDTLRYYMERIEKSESKRRGAVEDIHAALYALRVIKYQPAVVNHVEALTFHTEDTEVRAVEAKQALERILYKEPTKTILPGILPGL